MKQSRRAAIESGRCDIARCKREAASIYLGRNVCERCWSNLMSEKYPDSGELRRRLGIKEAK